MTSSGAVRPEPVPAGAAPAESGQRDDVPPADRPIVPAYDERALGAVLPGAAAALGAPTELPALPLPAAERVCVVLLDGVGAELLAEAAADGDAPFLTELAAGADVPGLPPTLRVGCPTTTATSMGSFGTGLPPGRHGLVGYQVRDPGRGTLLHELKWDPYTDPVDWQPHPTVFGRLVAAGIAVTNIGNPEFAGSGLTAAAHRGGDFLGVTDLAGRVAAAVDLLRRRADALVYLYWGAIDTAGHEHGWRSRPWRRELRRTDASLAELAAGLPRGTLLVVTADHGMVDVPRASRFDIAERPELRRGIALFGGEPRLVQLYGRDPGAGAAAEMAARFADALGERAWVRTRDEAVAEGWFGPVDARVALRIGDVLVAARDDFALIDSATMHERSLALIGQHGSLTEAEQIVPLLVRRI